MMPLFWLLVVCFLSNERIKGSGSSLSLTNSLLQGGVSQEADDADDEDDDDDEDEDGDDDDEAEDEKEEAKAQVASATRQVQTNPILQSSLLQNVSNANKQGPTQSRTLAAAQLAPPPPLANKAELVLTKKEKIMKNIMNPQYPCHWRANAFAQNYCCKRLMVIEYPPL